MFSEIKEVYRFREMLVSVVRRDLRSRYKGSFLGFLWTFINPLLQLVVYSIVFPYLLRMEQENYPMFLFVALLPWILFSTSVQGATTSVVTGANLVKKIYFPRMILPLTAVFTNLMNYIYSLLIVFIALYFTGIEITLNVLWLPIVILVELLFIIGLSLIFSALYVRYRDLEHLVGVLVFVWFYLTPVVFPMSLLPTQVVEGLNYNPLVPIIEAFRDILLNGVSPQWGELSYSLFVGVTLTVVGLMVFKECDKTFAEDL